MKDLILITDHSANNNDVFELSQTNHNKYCIKYNYDMLNTVNAYYPYNRGQQIKFLSNYYKYICYIGTDIIITRMDLLLVDLLNQHETFLTGCKQNHNYKCEQYVINGDFLCFNSKIEYLELFNKYNNPNKYPDTQTALFDFTKRFPNLYNNIEMLQCCYINMNKNFFILQNENQDFYNNNYFSIHFHHYSGGKSPIEKSEYMNEFKNKYPQYF